MRWSWLLLLVALIGGPVMGQTAAADTPVAAEEQASDQAEDQDVEEGEASPEESATFLENIFVTATGIEAPDFDLPYTVQGIDQVTLREERLIRSLPEALTETPAVSVQKTSHGQGSPFIRGFTGFRTLLMVDGIRLNNSTFRDGPNQYWNTVDPWSLDTLELVKGPSSVLYGSDAIGGTVNVLSTMPSFDEGAGGRVIYRYSSAENSHLGRAEFHGGGDKARVHGGVSFQDYGNLEAGGSVGEQPMTGYDRLDADLKLEILPNDTSQLVVAYQQNEVNDAWRTHRTIFGINWLGTTNGTELQRILDQERRLGYVQYRWTSDASWFDNATASLSYHEQQEDRFRERSDGRVDEQGFTVGTTGLWLRFDKLVESGSWSYGAEYYSDDVDSFRQDYAADGTAAPPSIQGPVGDDATYDLGGLFVQNERELSERVTLLLGARYTIAEADAKRVQDPLTGDQIRVTGDWDDIVGNIRLLVSLDSQDQWRLFGGLSQGFRAPNLSDLTRLDSARSNEIETPAPDLESEQFNAWELGIKRKNRDSSFEFATFYTDISDMIVRAPTGRVIDGENEVTKKNGGDGFVAGVEVRFSTRIAANWELFGDGTYIDGEVDTFPTSEPVLVREPIDRLMPTTLRIGTRLEPRGARYWAEGLITLVDDADRLSTRDKADTDRIPLGGTPGYELLTLRGGYQIRPQLALSLVLDNLTDEEYRVHGSGLNGPGRNLIVAFNGSF